MPVSDVFLGDNMDFMRICLNDRFDLAIVDVPYTDDYEVMDSLNQDMKGKQAMVGKYHYNSFTNAKPTAAYWEELRRVSKNQIVWGANYLIENLSSTPCVIVWDKNNSGNFADCEIAFATFKTGAKIFKYTWNGMIQENMKNKEIRISPTQKPIALYKWLLKNYAKEGDIIFDSHMGSQSSRIAAYDMGFDYYGCEIDRQYFDEGCKRFELYKSQLKLF